MGELVARRRQVIEMIVAEGHRRRKANQRRVIRAIERHIAVLQEELSELDGDIDQAIGQSLAWQADAELLQSVPGVGPATLRTPIAELPKLGARAAGVSKNARRRSTQHQTLRPSRVLGVLCGKELICRHQSERRRE